MKKIIAMLLAGIMTVGLCACGTDAEKDKQTGATYTITYNANEGNVEGMPDYQFVGVDFSQLLTYDSRANVELVLKLDGNGNYELQSDFYVVESNQRQEVGSETGIGVTWRSDITGNYEENADGTITISEGRTVNFKVETDTYSSQMKDTSGFSINGSTEDGEWNSVDTPEILAYAPETVFTVDGNAIVSYYNPNAVEEVPDTGMAEEDDTKASEIVNTGEVLLEVSSDDEGTSFTFYDDGTYAFYFAAYDIKDAGTYIYADGVLSMTDKNGAETVSTVEGETLKFHYEYSDSSQLTGDYTIAVSDLEEVFK